MVTVRLLSRYTHGLGLISKDDNFYTFDGNGNTSKMTNAPNEIINFYGYEPFGNNLFEGESVENDFEFVGQFGVRDMGDDLIYMRNRFYSPVLGRFMAEDPIGLAGVDVIFYRYVQNDPVNFVDPLGLAPFYNRSSHPIVVGGGTGPGQGHEGPHIQVTVPPGGIVDVNHPAYDSNGNGPLMDVDSVDTNRHAIADPPSGVQDMYPLGEKNPGSDKGPGVTAFDTPFSDNGIFLVPMQYITDDSKCK